jgi:hypothetical protein
MMHTDREQMEKGKGMNALANFYEAISETNRATDASETVASATTTTLYDLIAALQDTVEPDEETYIVPIVTQWLRSGRLRFHRDLKPLIRDL